MLKIIQGVAGVCWKGAVSLFELWTKELQKHKIRHVVS